MNFQKRQSFYPGACTELIFTSVTCCKYLNAKLENDPGPEPNQEFLFGRQTKKDQSRNDREIYCEVLACKK